MPLAPGAPPAENGGMSKRYYQVAVGIAAALSWVGYWLGHTNASDELQLIWAVAGIVLPFAVALIAITLVAMQAYTEAEPDPFEELARTYRRKPDNSDQRAH
jgi:hypothetical protein